MYYEVAAPAWELRPVLSQSAAAACLLSCGVRTYRLVSSPECSRYASVPAYSSHPIVLWCRVVPRACSAFRTVLLCAQDYGGDGRGTWIGSYEEARRIRGHGSARSLHGRLMMMLLLAQPRATANRPAFLPQIKCTRPLD